MTSPEWEAANEDDSDRFPQTPHAPASESTESHEQGSRVVPDPARVARYAEAIYESRDKPSVLEAQTWAEMTAGAQRYWHAYARGAMAVADEERAALVAEAERTRNASKQNAIQASRADRRADRLEARAEAAEAKVAKVEALADEWEGERDTCLAWIADPTMHVDPEHPQRLSKMADLLNRHAGRIRAVLADAPAEQRAEGGVRMCACGHVKESHDASGECFACAGPPCDGGSDQ